MEQWCDSCGKMTNWINGECENYQPIKTSNSTSMETSPSKAPLTWEQAKDQVVKKDGWIHWKHYERNLRREIGDNTNSRLERAAELMCASRVQALEEEFYSRLNKLSKANDEYSALVKELKEQNKRLQERIDIADKLLLEARQRWSRGDHFEYCDMWQMGYDEYDSLNQKI